MQITRTCFAKKKKKENQSIKRNGGKIQLDFSPKYFGNWFFVVGSYSTPKKLIIVRAIRIRREFNKLDPPILY